MTRESDRRGFLLLATAGYLSAQTPPPPKAKITSSVMLWTLTGTFEERVKTAALAGFQAVGLTDEYATWDAATLRKAKQYINSFGMTVETILATPNWETKPVSLVNPMKRNAFLNDLRAAIGAAKHLEAPYITVTSGNEMTGSTRESQYASLLEGGKLAAELAAANQVTLIVTPLNNKVDHKGCFLASIGEGLKLVKELDSPHVRLLCNVYHEQVQEGSVLPILTESLDYAAMIQIADAPGRSDPGTGTLDFREIYRAIGKSGYHRSLAMEYRPKGKAVDSLKKAVDGFRAGVNERNGSTPTEGNSV